ncbi:MAG TPA: N-acetylmuramoyl-L-alanine amidase [Candidatus Sulfotelmatobacter sp.]|nr:N-acetylmuramoyl-L-alanine amidase [Candidatus Sulfotelmatobacter sp.]
MRARRRAVVEHPSPNFGPRPTDAAIDLLILHYTGMQSAEAAIARLCDRAAAVSAHYVIDEDGTVYRLVDERERAWHAGVSAWQGRGDVNSFSVGIELVNPGHEWGYRAFPAAQLAACAQLSRAIVKRHAIPASRVLGHSDVAPARKQDPGERFDWAHLAHHGVGLWPPDEPADGDDDETGVALLARGAGGPAVLALQTALVRFGYSCPTTGMFDAATETVVLAFQRHFRPGRLDGRFDRECRRRLAWLLAEMD